jgi:DNA-binding SARP family transcriptional activator
MSAWRQESGRPARDPGCGQFTPQAVIRTLGQLEGRAAKASDDTLASAVSTGRMALAEWQDLSGRLRELEGQYERLAQCEAKALARLQDILDLLDRFAEPRPASAPARPDRAASARRALPTPPGAGRDAPRVLAVRMLGPFELSIGGRRVTQWRGQRTQSLMQFLATHRRRSVLGDELIEAVWPDTDEDCGRHRLHQAVYELRCTLRGADPKCSPIVCADGGYGLDHDAPVWVDAEEFEELASAAARCSGAQQADQVIRLSRNALDLYRGDFLCQATEADWATTERNRLRARYVQLSIQLGELLAWRGDCVTALAVIDPVLNMEPWNEDATMIKMRCHARTGARSLAAAAFRSCADALTQEFGIAPAAPTVRVHEQIRAAEPAGHSGGLTAAQSRIGPRPSSPQAPGAARPSRLITDHLSPAAPP